MNHPKDHHKCFARLACVKHAASVHPEPGSNSLKKFVQDQIFAWLNFIPFYLLWFCSLRTKFFWTFKDMSLFSYQGSLFFRCSSATFISYHVRFSLSRTFLTFFWKVFVLSNFFRASPPQLPATLTIISPLPRNVNTFFWNFLYFLNCWYNYAIVYIIYSK